MSLPRIGKDIPAAQHWAETGSDYRGTIDHPYHRHRLRVVRALIDGVQLQAGAACLDLGCGDGVLLEEMVRRGARPIGIDPSREMLDAARRRLAAAGVQADLREGDTDALTSLPAGSVDCLLAINVLHYLSDVQEARFYRELARVVRPGGSFIVLHSNLLFDLFTLNAYTVEFFAEHLVGATRRAEIAKLLAHPDQPSRRIQNIRENPLIYGHKLARHGFEERQQEFANLHPLPPLLIDPALGSNIDRKDYPDTLNRPPEERWKLHFMCSMFGSRAVRQA